MPRSEGNDGFESALVMATVMADNLIFVSPRSTFTPPSTWGGTPSLKKWRRTWSKKESPHRWHRQIWRQPRVYVVGHVQDEPTLQLQPPNWGLWVEPTASWLNSTQSCQNTPEIAHAVSKFTYEYKSKTQTKTTWDRPLGSWACAEFLYRPAAHDI